jgi:thiamine biosynthesis lipoprotein
LLGTLVEVGVHGDAADPRDAVDAAFASVAEVQRCLSRFEADSDVTRFHALAAGASLAPCAHTLAVLTAAQALHEASDGVFDITLGTAPQGWRCDGGRWHKLSDAVRVDLGGIAKGYAVDCAVATLIARGCRAGWVNAGGDLRAFGHAELPVALRDEADGGVRPFASLSDGAFATSHLGNQFRSLAASSGSVRAHASVAAPLCLWADALTKVVAITGNAAHPLLLRFEAQAWLH